MSFLILPGRDLNILEGCISITASDPEAGYDEESVANNVPSHPFRFDDAGTDDYLLADLNRISNAGYESWAVDSVPDDYSASGTVVKENTIKHGGSYSCELAASAYIWRIVWVQSGWDMTAEAWFYGDAAQPNEGIIQNLYTGNFLTSGGAWQSGSAAWGSRTAASWGLVSRTFTVESYTVCGYQHLVPLLYKFNRVAGGAAGYVDDVALWPHWNFASVHGHNIPPSIAVKMQSDDNSSMSSPTLHSTMTVIQPAFFDTIGSMVTERYARLFLDGTVHQEKAVYIGEWVLGQYKTLAKGMGLGPDYMRVMPVSQASSISRTPRSDWSHRGLRLDFTNNDAALTTMYEMLDRARGGADPFVIVPLDTEDDVFFGYFPSELSVNRLFSNHQAYQIEFREMAFPLSF